MPVLKGTKGKTELDLHTLGRLMKPVDGDSICCIEQVASMPKQGLSSTFRFGQGYGAVQMAAIGHGYVTHYVTPPVWKKHFKLSRDKGVSRGLAMRLFPENAQLFSRVKDDGRAEAALIAQYTREVLI